MISATSTPQRPPWACAPAAVRPGPVVAVFVAGMLAAPAVGEVEQADGEADQT
jgi:hypothetical protein